jgi:hypothetical protein
MIWPTLCDIAPNGVAVAQPSSFQANTVDQRHEFSSEDALLASEGRDVKADTKRHSAHTRGPMNAALARGSLAARFNGTGLKVLRRTGV